MYMNFSAKKQLISREISCFVELVARFELATYALRVRRSTD